MAISDVAQERRAAGMSARQLAALRGNTFGALVLLIVQFAIGIVVNLYATIPAKDKGSGIVGAVGRALANGPVSLATHAGLGLLIVLAGIALVAEHWREVIESDLTSTFLTVSAFLPAMIARRSGAIITMSSAAARQAARSSAAYAAAKSGVIAFSRHLAGEFAKDGIRVNCVAPSAIENDHMRSWVPEEQRKELAAVFPLGRLGQPEDVAAATLFLASSASSWITGVTLDIAGGKVML